MIMKAFQKVGLYFYILPSYVQAKRIIWDGITIGGKKFLDYVPKEIIKSKNETEMKLTLTNGSMIQLIGSDNYDGLRGTNPIGCIFSEFAYQHPMAWEVIKPILTVNKGWALFNTTSNGKNHAYDLWMMALNESEWFTQKLTVDDTGVLTKEDIDKERREGMSEEMIQQEYFSSFDIGILGAYYSKQLQEAREQNRICNVPIEKNVPVQVFCDLGKNDGTTLLFMQIIGKEIRIIDYYEAQNEEIAHYIRVMKDKKFTIERLNLPHDATHKRMESGKTIEEQFKDGGFRTRIIPKSDLLNGIQEARKVFPRCWFDKERCKGLILALEDYHKEYDQEKKVFKDHPLHSWSEAGASSFRYMALGFKEPKLKIRKESKPFNRFKSI
jgi:hypothetical protein